jgi:hypothetical protein
MSALQESIAKLPTNQQLELAQWILGSVQAQLNDSSIPDLTPLELQKALQRATDDPTNGKTPEQLFAAIKTNRETRNA